MRSGGKDQMVMHRVRWDPTISLGTVLHLVGLIGAGVGLYIKMSERLTILETQMRIVLGNLGIAH
jgi:hypothetical protein